MTPVKWSKGEIERQYKMAPAMLRRAVESKRPEAVEFCLESIKRIIEAKSCYEESENESVPR